ncbi:hypothetical protein [Tateyamaria sp. ANG-S1]|uniref:hypothetical protein n=1 Tax=Tateyamaria sp. ANG-S1 TaxID=1577905 RepID=UPI00057FF8FC|nr:hypothetical protein [Tateyamaria sp. ANG-S1]KIC45479.1 hypothetical protein RA29_20840 [Tateyamaria sp. ANG-S1]
MAPEKALADMTMDELDAIIGPATLKAAQEGLAEGALIVFGDSERTYRQWPDGRVEVNWERGEPDCEE